MEKGILGPHEGKELELMLRGEKQVALFNQELGIPDAFLPYLELGMLHSKTVQRHVSSLPSCGPRIPFFIRIFLSLK